MPVHESKTHVALLVSPGIGHLIPFIELANRLVLHHGLEASVFVVGTGSSSAESQILQKAAAEESLNVVYVTPVELSPRLDPDAILVEKIKDMMNGSFELLRSAIAAMTPPPVALIVDLFGTEALAMARELGLLGYVFMTSNAWFLSLTLFYRSMERQSIDD